MKILFETPRLIIREMVYDDIAGFYDLQSNKKAMDMVPDKVMTMQECKDDLNIRISNYSKIKKPFDVWGVFEINSKDFIGTCAMVYQTEKTVEIGYRFREKYWRGGIGSEVTKNLIDYIFKETKYTKVVADVSKFNIGSTKILSKFMTQIGESFNEADNCMDLHFEVTKKLF